MNRKNSLSNLFVFAFLFFSVQLSAQIFTEVASVNMQELFENHNKFNEYKAIIDGLNEQFLGIQERIDNKEDEEELKVDIEKYYKSLIELAGGDAAIYDINSLFVHYAEIIIDDIKAKVNSYIDLRSYLVFVINADDKKIINRITGGDKFSTNNITDLLVAVENKKMTVKAAAQSLEDNGGYNGYVKNILIGEFSDFLVDSGLMDEFKEMHNKYKKMPEGEVSTVQYGESIRNFMDETKIVFVDLLIKISIEFNPPYAVASMNWDGSENYLVYTSENKEFVDDIQQEILSLMKE